MTRSRVAVEARSKRVVPRWARRASAGCLQVLLVDDEIDLLLPLADALRHAGVATTIATSSDEALFESEVSPPDVVVLAAEMAERGLLSRLRALLSTLPVVLMNSPARHDVTWRAMLATVGVTCIDEPVHVRELLDLLSDSSRFPRRSANDDLLPDVLTKPAGRAWTENVAE